MQRVAVREPARACGSGRSPPNSGEPTDSPAVVRFAPAADPRAGSARVPWRRLLVARVASSQSAAPNARASRRAGRAATARFSRLCRRGRALPSPSRPPGSHRQPLPVRQPRTAWSVAAAAELCASDQLAVTVAAFGDSYGWCDATAAPIALRPPRPGRRPTSGNPSGRKRPVRHTPDGPIVFRTVALANGGAGERWRWRTVALANGGAGKRWRTPRGRRPHRRYARRRWPPARSPPVAAAPR